MENDIQKKQIKWLRISCWIAAVVDLIFAVFLIFFPGVTEFIWQLDSPIQGTDLLWTKYFGTLVFAWTCVLFWADRKPVERRGVVYLTIAPVIAGLISVKTYGVVYGLASPMSLGLLIGMLTLILIPCFLSYFYSREMSKTYSRPHLTEQRSAV